MLSRKEFYPKSSRGPLTEALPRKDTSGFSFRKHPGCRTEDDGRRPLLAAGRSRWPHPVNTAGLGEAQPPRAN